MISLLDKTGIGRGEAAQILDTALKGADDGELFVEQRLSEHAVFDDGRLKSASFDEAQGFGLRVVSGETQGYSHSTELSAAAMKRAADICRTIIGGPASAVAQAPARTNRELYPAKNPSDHFAFADKVTLLQQVDDFARKADPRIKQVSVSLSGDWQEIEILRTAGEIYRDSRPLVRFQVSVMASDGSERASGSYGFGGRGLYSDYVTEATWQDAVREAVRQSLVGLEAKPAPAGEMDVVLGPGWPGILLHEAIGHGLEGDFNRKKTSAFAGLMGERIAARGITVVDDGTVARARGSIAIDDEGTPSSSTTLIEDGILVGYMQDRLNARLMGMKPTGNGRRQSFAHSPMPRMTNTYMLNGDKHPDEILASVKNGLFAKSFGGGQVDITSGKFVFSCTEAYLIENGRITTPVKGATIIGNGADALKRISMVGNDMALDPGIGTCGKQGQGVPVCVGQPSLRLDQITVGGTAA
ncbi:metalloprotease TldD [Taklimakanibacter albus]|uniref:Metalloprotease TldD n=1 Tax=Taklimakanibacter albus TaxID=2800327 RepID=A0ACC5RCW4_9HYPH|nr:metalloprotease TldD [Aestuariivirga sp. YIM B02566]MBK1870474.1 metalloprotease TldD [Aestuariivirga sp. YIM B02566]